MARKLSTHVSMNKLQNDLLHRGVALVLLAAMVFNVANFYLDLGFFGRAARLLLGANALVILIYVVIWSPVLRDDNEQTDHDIESKGDRAASATVGTEGIGKA